MSESHFTIPMEPPTVNHYVKHTRQGRHYKTALAKVWESTAAAFLRPQSVIAGNVEVEYTVYRGKGSRGDVDNYAKCILDSLVTCGVILADNNVVRMIANKDRDRENPRTEIFVRRLA